MSQETRRAELDRRPRELGRRRLCALGPNRSFSLELVARLPVGFRREIETDDNATTASQMKSLSPKQQFVDINIIDSGSGFSEQDLPFVFERLYRGDPSRVRNRTLSAQSILAQSSTMQAGSGLGLSIVEQIIQAHGGSVAAKNHPETGGAWIQLILPILSTEIQN